ncbi:transcription factor bHLH143-like [Olea europaea var. sylvestris]|uniref:transcription factor bHLH143-like n=1 Tax=Olea europaea var. sylvestris TaxID=158386 RepID=UPI000C1CF1B4|nr:transcription factor bHLH143-like [Olea europaea var. sylvestris]
MVKAKESCQQLSAWNLPNLDDVALLQLRQNNSLPWFPNSSTFSANVGFPGCTISNLPGSKTGQLNRVDGFFQHLCRRFESSSPIINPYLKDSQCGLSYGLGMSANPAGASFTSQKKFLIFDQSDNNTRLFFSPSFSPSQNQIVASNTAAGGCGTCDEMAVQMDQEPQSLVKPIILEKWDENDSAGGSEVHEDTEEINALLYSNSNDEYDDDGENDEVTSTGHTPLTIEEGYDKDIQIGELVEEVASSNGSVKRQKLLDGGYKKSSLLDTRGPVKRDSPLNYEDDVESSCAGEHNSDDIDSIKRVKKVKIRESLKILQSIIPGLKNKDPLLIIDKAISYLNYLNWYGSVAQQHKHKSTNKFELLNCKLTNQQKVCTNRQINKGLQIAIFKQDFKLFKFQLTSRLQESKSSPRSLSVRESSLTSHTGSTWSNGHLLQLLQLCFEWKFKVLLFALGCRIQMEGWENEKSN